MGQHLLSSPKEDGVGVLDDDVVGATYQDSGAPSGSQRDRAMVARQTLEETTPTADLPTAAAELAAGPAKAGTTNAACHNPVTSLLLCPPMSLTME